MKAEDIKKVACVGAGVIGASFALNFAMQGYPVCIYDIEQKPLDVARNNILNNLDILQKNNILTKQASENTLALLKYTTNLSEAVKDVQFIQESGPENYEIKQKVLAEVEKYTADNTIIASSTSGLLISEIAKFTVHPERCVGAHPYNPPHIIPLVEITKGDKSDPEVVQCAYDFYVLLGKEPIILQKEAVGFIANRLQVALYREAVDLVERGVCSIEDVDKAVTFGLGLRWAILGPNLVFQLGGGVHGIKGIINHIGPSAEKWWDDMAAWKKFPEGWANKAQEGVDQQMMNRSQEFGKTSQEILEFRDRLMIEILKLHKKI